ncbi:retinol dehydrogenase [Acrasis kona]|uniref:Retinol dehydrogenase n=1 Tax=Acrasis kona TaxID=1008807 RepID=A0AAW2Z1H9_9EUKA
MSDKFSTANNKHVLNGRSALVIGGTQGIGMGVAQVLAERGASVVVAGRNLHQDGNGTNYSKEKQLQFSKVDLASNVDIKRFAGTFSDEQFDYIVWSAGIFPSGARRETNEGVELTFQIDYLSKFVGLQLLTPKLKEGGRMVTILSPYVESLWGRFISQFDVDDLEFKKPKRFEETQAHKMNITLSILTDLLIKRLSEQHPTKFFSHVHPGQVGSNLLKNSEVPFQTIKELFAGNQHASIKRTPVEYGEVAVFLLTDEDIGKKSGAFYDSEVKEIDQSEFEKKISKQDVDKIWEYSKRVSNTYVI